MASSDRVVIEVREPDRPPRRVTLTATLEMGRECSGLIVRDPSASRRHVALTVGATGVTVTDLGSTNGTEVDGRLITAPMLVGVGSVVRFGNTEVAVMERTAAPPPGAKAPPERLTVQLSRGQMEDGRAGGPGDVVLTPLETSVPPATGSPPVADVAAARQALPGPTPPGPTPPGPTPPGPTPPGAGVAPPQVAPPSPAPASGSAPSAPAGSPAPSPAPPPAAPSPPAIPLPPAAATRVDPSGRVTLLALDGDVAGPDRWPLVATELQRYAASELPAVAPGSLVVVLPSPRHGLMCAIAIQRTLENHRRTGGGSPSRVRVALDVATATALAELLAAGSPPPVAMLLRGARAEEIVLSPAMAGEASADAALTVGDERPGPAPDLVLRALSWTG